MEQYLKVTDNENLVRDMSSGAILVANNDEYEKHKKKLYNAMETKRKIDSQDQEIQDLKSEISELKQLIASIIANK